MTLTAKCCRKLELTAFYVDTSDTLRISDTYMCLTAHRLVTNVAEWPLWAVKLFSTVDHLLWCSSTLKLTRCAH